jgi:hypothetical protein
VVERRLEQEWWWINGALHAVTQLQAEGPRTIRELDTQARNIDRKRTAISLRLAQLCPPSDTGPNCRLSSHSALRGIAWREARV